MLPAGVVLGRDIAGRPDAGVVDEDVEGAGGGLDRRDRSLDRGAVGHIGRDECRAGGERVGGGDQVEGEDSSAVLRQTRDDRGTDAAGAARNDGDEPVKVTHRDRPVVPSVVEPDAVLVVRVVDRRRDEQDLRCVLELAAMRRVGRDDPDVARP